MKQRSVYFSPEAHEDLLQIYDWIANAGAPQNALSYIERIEQFCSSLGLASLRGQSRDDVRPHLRVVGFEQNITIAFSVTDSKVIILRVFYGGRDWEKLLSQ